MQSIRELIYFLSQYDIQPLNQQGHPFEDGSKVAELYKGILTQKFRTDEDAEKAIYPGPDSNNKYRQIKFFLRDRLMDAVSRFNVHNYKGKFTDYQFAYYDCHRQWFTIKILIGHNANTAAISMAVKLLRQAIKYEFTLLCVDITSFLLIQYGLREGYDKKYEETLAQFTHYQELYQAEITVSKLYTMLMSQYTTSRSSKSNLGELVKSYFSQIKDVLQEYDSYTIQMHGNMIELMTYTVDYDYKSALQCCERAIRVFQSKPYNCTTPLQVYYYQKLVCHIQLKQFEQGSETARVCFEITREGTFNWFKSHELYFYLSMHTEQYAKAAEIINAVLRHPRFQFLPEIVKETWSIFEHYGYYLSALGKIPGHTNFRFKPTKFSNDLPKFTKDKAGMNIAIIILKIIFMIHERRESKFLDQIEAIEQYCYRHLNEPETRRSFKFIKMLLQIPLRNFNVEEFRQNAEKILSDLNATPHDISMQTYEIEIIPFEKLWDMVLASLEDKRAVLAQ